jgi:hypothetical protein
MMRAWKGQSKREGSIYMSSELSGDRSEWSGGYRQKNLVLGGGGSAQQFSLQSQRWPGCDGLPCILVQVLEESAK